MLVLVVVVVGGVVLVLVVMLLLFVNVAVAVVGKRELLKSYIAGSAALAKRFPMAHSYLPWKAHSYLPWKASPR